MYHVNRVICVDILVVDVSYETKTLVLESPFLLQFKPLLLENVHGLVHFAFGQEVPDEVVNDHRSLDRHWFLILVRQLGRHA